MKPLTIHHTPELHPDTRTPDPHQDTFSKTVLGFWMYLMTDCILFTALFATYAVLYNPISKDFFDLSRAFVETMILLTSSMACGLGILAAERKKRGALFAWFTLSFILGASFVAIELQEFSSLVHEGYSWTKSAYLSAFFTLVGTHGLHVTFGLVWMALMLGQVFFIGVTPIVFRRLFLLSLFWHFLDVVWIFIFTFVYLMGAL